MAGPRSVWCLYSAPGSARGQWRRQSRAGGEGRREKKEAAVIFKGRAGEVEGLRRERRDILSLLLLLPTCLEFRSVNQEALMEITIRMCTSEGWSPPAPKHERACDRAHLLPQNQRQQSKERTEM